MKRSTFQDKLDALEEVGIDDPVRSQLAAHSAVTPWAVKEEAGKPDANPKLIVHRLRRLCRDAEGRDAREEARKADLQRSDAEFWERKQEQDRILALDAAAKDWLATQPEEARNQAWIELRREMRRTEMPDRAWRAFPVRLARWMGWEGTEDEKQEIVDSRPLSGDPTGIVEQMPWA